MNKYLGIKTKFMILHLDEKTPLCFLPILMIKSSITHLNKTTNRLSPLQDIAHKHFGKTWNWKGIKKKILQNSKHMSAAKIGKL